VLFLGFIQTNKQNKTKQNKTKQTIKQINKQNMSSNRFFFSAISSSSRRQQAHQQQTNNCLRRFSEVVARPKQPVSKQERAILRADRKERASQFIQKSKGGAGGEAGSSSSSSSSYSANKYFWYGSVGIPSALLIWGFSDSNSPPAKFCNLIGLSGFVQQYTDQIAKPAHEKLLPDWSQVRKCKYLLCFVAKSLLERMASKHYR
jgi:hypothetical protein